MFTKNHYLNFAIFNAIIVAAGLIDQKKGLVTTYITGTLPGQEAHEANIKFLAIFLLALTIASMLCSFHEVEVAVKKDGQRGIDRLLVIAAITSLFLLQIIRS